MSEQASICMCGARARRAYDSEGAKLDKCARCGNSWPRSMLREVPSSEEFTRWSNAKQQPSGRPAATTPGQAAGADLAGLLCGGVWVVALLPMGYAVLSWMATYGEAESAIQAVQVSVEAMGICLIAALVAHGITQAIRGFLR